MSTVTMLNKVKNFMEEEVCKNINLQSYAKKIGEYKLQNPNAFIGYIPPKEFLPDKIETEIPCVIVGLNDGGDRASCQSDNDSEQFEIRLTFAVYSPGEHLGNGNYKESFNGYMDLLNFMDLAKAKLYQKCIPGYSWDSELQLGTYAEQPYPMWYGFIIFSLKKEPYPRVDVEQFLLNM